MRTVGTIAAGVALGTACKNSTPPEPPPVEAGPARVDASVAMDDAGAPDAARARVAPEVKPLTDDDKKKLTEYRAAMKAGRAAMTRKDFKSAIASFDKALEANAGDGRALLARGEAELMSTPPQYDRALADLENAMRAVNEPALAAQIQLDVGLVYEGRKETLLAQTAFARSSGIFPTRAASTKMTGSPRKCSAAIDRNPVPGVQAPGWVAAWTAMAEEYKKENADAPALPPAPASDAAAKSLLCDSRGCAGSGPWVVKLGTPSRQKAFLLTGAAKTGDRLVAYALDTIIGSGQSAQACAAEEEHTLTTGRLIRVRVKRDYAMSSLAPPGSADAGTGDGGSADAGSADAGADGGACETEQGLAGCGRTCVPSTFEEIDYVIDPLRKLRLLRVSEVGIEEGWAAHTRRVTVHDAPRGIDIAGGGCDDHITVIAPNAQPK